MSDKDKLIIGQNLKQLRKLKNLTQQELADKLNIRRSSIGAYEECRATPRYETLESVSDFFGLPIDTLIREDLSQINEQELIKLQKAQRGDSEGKPARILAITVDRDNKPNIDYVHQPASAGYLNGLADKEYIEELPKFQLPIPSLARGTFRAFEIKGDSMLPLKSGSIVVGEYVENLRDIKEGQTYIVISQSEGIVYKRVYLGKNEEENRLRLVSDNPIYTPYHVGYDDVQELWKAKIFISSELPEPDMSLEKLSTIVMELQQEVIKLRGSN